MENNQEKFKILHLEDFDHDAEEVSWLLKKAKINCEIKVAHSRLEYIEALETFNPDIILSDHSLPSFNSLEALAILKKSDLNIPFILLTGAVSEEFAANVMKDGATDYILKDRPHRLPSAILNALQQFKSEQEKQAYLQKLLKNEKYYRSLIENISDGIILLNKKFEIVYQSPSVKNLTFFEPEELHNKPFASYLHLDDQEKIISCFTKSITEPQLLLIEEARFINKTGDYFPIEINIKNMLADENIAAIVVNIRDITQRKLDKIKLQESESFSNGVLSSLHSHIAVINNTGNIIAVNKVWEEFGLNNGATSKEKISIGSNYIEVCKKASAEGDEISKQVLKGIENVLNQQMPYYELEYPCHSEYEKRWFLLNIMTLGSDTEKVVLAHHNITERKLAENALSKSESRLKTIFENTLQGYILTNIFGKILAYNTRGKEIIGNSTAKELTINSNISNFLADSSEDYYEILNTVSKGNNYKYHYHKKNNDGETKWYSCSISPVKNENKIDGFCFAIYDITERKTSEIQTLELIDKLQYQNRTLGQFAYMISHNLRSPIAKILGLTSILGDDEQENKFILEKIVESAHNLDEVVKDMNTVVASRSITNDTKEHCLLDKKVKQVIESLEREIIESHAVIEWDFKKANAVTTTKSYLYSILQNLIANAIKFRSANSPLKIFLETVEEDTFIRLSVKDNGLGMDLAKHKEKIFDLYSRFHGDTIQGKGIGLHLVKVHAEAIGGKVEVESKINEGTTFYIFIPK